LQELVEVGKLGDIALGGMKLVKAGDVQVVVCNCDGNYYAVSRRCGHMNSPLEMGALDGTILTCAMHHAQFDVTTGEALNRPIPEYFGGTLPDELVNRLIHTEMLMRHISVCDIRTFPVNLRQDTIEGEVE